MVAVRHRLSGTDLKMLALMLMIMDHIHYFFKFTGAVPVLFNMLGRLSAPLFLFCVVEGFAHTHDRKRYILRIWAIGAAMGVVTYLMIYMDGLRRPDGFYPINGIFLNFSILGVIWQGIDWMRAGHRVKGGLAVTLPWIWGVVVVMLSVTPEMTRIFFLLGISVLPAWTCILDGGPVYLIGGVLLYLFRGNRSLQLTSWVVWILGMEFLYPCITMHEQSGFAIFQMFTMHYQWFSAAAVGLMALYNGTRGAGHKWLFYLVYPVHVYLFYAVSCLFFMAS